MQGTGLSATPTLRGTFECTMKQKIWKPYTYQHLFKNNFRCFEAKRSMRKFTCKNADHKWPHLLNVVVSYRACDYMMS